MSKFESFCKNIHKTDAGYVPDLLDLVAQGFGDLCMAAFLADSHSELFARLYMNAPDHKKNHVYSTWESKCQDAIDAYNQTIDDARDLERGKLAPDTSYFDEHWKYAATNQAEIDAGFSGTGREFC